MKRTLTGHLSSQVGKQVLVQGFIQTIRDQKRMAFLVLRDSTGVVQVVIDKQTAPSHVKQCLERLTLESTISVSGLVVMNTQAKPSGLELKIITLEIKSIAKTPVPIAPDSSLETRLDWRFLSLRFPEMQLILRVQTTMEMAMREFWAERGFVEIHSPKLMSGASESGAELFTLEYFKEGRASLAQSPQWYKQMAIAGGCDKVFEIGPVFRANPSFTSRHDTEFTSIDMEVAWIEDHYELMQLEQEWLVYVLGRVRDAHGAAIREQFGVEVIVPHTPFPSITLSEARDVLRVYFDHEIEDKHDLDPQGERMLAQHMLEKFGSEFVFVTDYPIEGRPFYHMRYEGQSVTKSYDLLWKGLEVTTGAQREHRPERLRSQAGQVMQDLSPVEDYLRFFEYGCPPHGGMGIGLTRLLMVMLERKSVREVTFVYRGPHRLRP